MANQSPDYEQLYLEGQWRLEEEQRRRENAEQAQAKAEQAREKAEAKTRNTT